MTQSYPKSNYGRSSSARIIVVVLTFFLGLAVNFFLTPNPYQAYHSGRAAQWASVQSDAWTLHNGALLLVALGMGFLIRRTRLLWSTTILGGILTFLVVTSGLATGVITTHLETYLFMVASFVAVMLIATDDAIRDRVFVAPRKVFILLAGCYLLGTLLAVIRPGVWGWIPFEFSRQARGEVTLAYLFSLPLLISSYYASYPPVRRRVFSSILLVVILVIEWSFVTRQTIWMTSFPLVLGLSFSVIRKLRLSNKMRSQMGSLLLILGLLSLFVLVLGVALIVDYDTLDTFLNHRLALWSFHATTFLENPWFGAGAFAVSRSNYDGVARSEVGVLSAFSEYGIGFGILQLAMVLMAVKNAVVALLNSAESNDARLVATIVLTMFPLFLLETGTRILNSTHLLFWYSVFWLLARPRRRKMAVRVESECDGHCSLYGMKVSDDSPLRLHGQSWVGP